MLHFSDYLISKLFSYKVDTIFSEDIQDTQDYLRYNEAFKIFRSLNS